MPTTRDGLLGAALRLIRNGEPVSLESVARAAGLTKPGLMYHFPTKAALMSALVDHLIDRYERELIARLPGDGSPNVEERLAAYVDWAFTADIDNADLVVFTDPRLRDQLTKRWTWRLRPWLEVPNNLPAGRRTRLLAARLIADGSWFADASGILPLRGGERLQVRNTALALIKEVP